LRVLTFSDGFTTDTTPTISTATIETELLVLPNQTTGKYLTLNGDKEVISATKGDADITGIEGDVTDLQTDMSMAQSDIVDLQSDVTSISASNDFINGRFDLWQSGTGAFTANNDYVGDGFKIQRVGSTFSATQQTNTLGLGFNSKFYQQIAVTSSAGASNYVLQNTYFEDVRQFAGTTRTYSFWAWVSSGTASISIEFLQEFGTGGSPSTAVNSIGVAKYSLTTTPTLISGSATFPSISGKTIGTDENTSHSRMILWMDAGSSFNSRTSSLGQQSATFRFGNFMMSEGSKRLPFSFHGGSMASDIIACQRLYEKSWDLTTAVGANVSEGCITGVAFSTTAILSNQGYKVVKRVIPTVSIYGRDGTINKVSTINAGTVTGLVNSSSSESTAKIGNIGYDTASFTAQTTYRYHFVANARF
jgi:hypothetical protein